MDGTRQKASTLKLELMDVGTISRSDQSVVSEVDVRG